MTQPKLYAARYDTARTTMEEFFEEPADVGVRCDLPGWLQRLEVTVRASSRHDAYERYRTHQGDGFALLDTYADGPIVDGWVYEVVPDNRHVTYIIGGGWKRMGDQFETDEPGNVDTDAYLKNTVLANHAPAISTDTSNIDSTGTPAQNLIDVNRLSGETPQGIVQTILKAGTTNDAPLDFWVQSQPFDGVTLQAPIPYLKERSDTASFDWQVDRENIGRQSLSRNIWDIYNDVKLFFDWITLTNGTHSAGATSLTVDNGTANWDPGQGVEIELDNDRTHRTFITATASTSLTLAEALPHSSPDNGLVSKVIPLQATGTATSTTSQSDYWTREYRQVEKKLRGSNSDLTLVHQLRDTILNELDEPVQRSSFSIGSRWVRDGAGARWPLWRMLKAPGYLRINDLFPAASLASTSLDDLRAFFVVSVDYNHNARRLRVTPDAFLGDNRLDVLLQRIGLGIGQLVDRS